MLFILLISKFFLMIFCILCTDSVNLEFANLVRQHQTNQKGDSEKMLEETGEKYAAQTNKDALSCTLTLLKAFCRQR